MLVIAQMRDLMTMTWPKGITVKTFEPRQDATNPSLKSTQENVRRISLINSDILVNKLKDSALTVQSNISNVTNCANSLSV